MLIAKLVVFSQNMTVYILCYFSIIESWDLSKYDCYNMFRYCAMLFLSYRCVRKGIGCLRGYDAYAFTPLFLFRVESIIEGTIVNIPDYVIFPRMKYQTKVITSY